MPRYQIQFLDSDGCGSYTGFDSERENAKEKACEVANEELQRQRNLHTPPTMFDRWKPVRTPRVVEYDSEKKCKKRGGEVFKLTLSFMEVTFKSGRKEKDEWYSVKNP